MNLRLDLYQVTEHAQDVMARLGITYLVATPQSLFDCWCFWGCKNVPDPLPPYLYVMKMDPRSKYACLTDAERELILSEAA